MRRRNLTCVLPSLLRVKSEQIFGGNKGVLSGSWQQRFLLRETWGSASPLTGPCLWEETSPAGISSYQTNEAGMASRSGQIASRLKAVAGTLVQRYNACLELHVSPEIETRIKIKAQVWDVRAFKGHWDTTNHHSSFSVPSQNHLRRIWQLSSPFLGIWW